MRVSEVKIVTSALHPSFSSLSLPRQQCAGGFVFAGFDLWALGLGSVLCHIPAPARISPTPLMDSWPSCTAGTEPSPAQGRMWVVQGMFQ